MSVLGVFAVALVAFLLGFIAAFGVCLWVIQGIATDIFEAAQKQFEKLQQEVQKATKAHEEASGLIAQALVKGVVSRAGVIAREADATLRSMGLEPPKKAV